MLLPNKKRQYWWLYRATMMMIVIAGVCGSLFVAHRIYEVSKIHMIDRANTLVQIISAPDVKALNANSTDFTNPAYIHVKKLFTSIRSVNHDIRFIYMNGIKDGELFFYADSEDPSSSEYSPPGESYPEATDLMKQLFVTKGSGFEYASDRWGGWVSAYAPVVDETGTVVALIGLDVPAQSFFWDMFVYGSIPLLLMVIALGILTSTHYVRERQLEYLDQKAEFLSIAAHEIRSPLTGIRWATENLLGTNIHILDEYGFKIITLINENCVALIGRINNLLNITTLESGKGLALHTENIPLLPLIRDVVTSLTLSAEARTVTLRIDPSLTPDIVLEGDMDKIRHVFSNLISNAIKYTGPNTDVVIMYKEDVNKQYISVRNKGEILSKEDQKHIFDGYHRTDFARHSHQYGTGLGLYLSQKIAGLHGGIITVSSTEEKTEFTLVLPVPRV